MLYVVRSSLTLALSVFLVLNEISGKRIIRFLRLWWCDLYEKTAVGSIVKNIHFATIVNCFAEHHNHDNEQKRNKRANCSGNPRVSILAANIMGTSTSSQNFICADANFFSQARKITIYITWRIFVGEIFIPQNISCLEITKATIVSVLTSSLLNFLVSERQMIAHTHRNTCHRIC
jgi:hypothetical protein